MPFHRSESRSFPANLLTLFGAANREGPDKYDDLVHLAHLTALLGSAPEELLIGRRASMFYKPGGSHVVERTYTPF